MASRLNPDQTVTQSVWERLVDREPSLGADPPITRLQSVRLLKASLRRDLEWLLNTRRIPEAADDTLAETSKSLFNYGLPDFSAMSLQSGRDRNKLLREVEAVVQMFEPRLRDVRVRMVEPPNTTTRAMSFQIEGMLVMDPAPEQVSFDTVLQLTSGEYQIKGDRNA